MDIILFFRSQQQPTVHDVGATIAITRIVAEKEENHFSHLLFLTITLERNLLLQSVMNRLLVTHSAFKTPHQTAFNDTGVHRIYPHLAIS